jgi:DNA adenine methylase
LSAPLRPVLRYHGGKWRLAPWIISHFPPHRVYTEAFGGGGSVLLRKPRSYAEVYNDLDGEVVNLFRVLRDRALAAELERVVRLTPFARDEFTLAYEPTDDPVEQARRTLFRSAAGFGSVAASGRKTGFRSNVTRSGSTPADDWRAMPDGFVRLVGRMVGVVIENRPAVDVMQHFDGTETLHYVDPPYPHSTRTGTAQYDRIYKHEMGDDEHRALAAALHALDGMVVLSGYACDLYDRELFADWHRVERRAFADGASARTEILWINPAAAARLTPTLNLGAA